MKFFTSDQRRMSKRVITITGYGDIHALVIDKAIHVLGGRHEIWNISDFPREQSITCRLSRSPDADWAVGTSGLSTDALDDVGIIWNRRPAKGNLYHIGMNTTDQSFVRKEVILFLRSLWLTVGRNALWINDPISRHCADAKMLQLSSARRAGLTVPQTMMTNDPDQLRSFVEECSGKVIYKSFHGQSWEEIDEAGKSIWFANFTAPLEIDKADLASITMAPGIYQEHLEKAFELRILICGATLFAVRIDSQTRGSTSLDFRSGQADLPLSEYILPDEVRCKILAFSRDMNVVFGSIDVIVTTSGEFIFLELNEQGQFLWMEFNNPALPILQLTADFFMSGSPDFVWQRPARPLRLEEIETEEFFEDFVDMAKSSRYKEIHSEYGAL
ncbi:hypothetical protein [Sphingomonas sp. PB1R3]|uniref:hypothetical protein n=1 Tax=Sphingomonas flavida TaxID=3096154 RepID=UPI002FC58F22